MVNFVNGYQDPNRLLPGQVNPTGTRAPVTRTAPSNPYGFMGPRMPWNNNPRNPYGSTPNPFGQQLANLQRQFRELYRSNPGAAYALYEQGSGANRGAMQEFIRNEVFGGDVNAMNQWKNTSAYTSANNYKYDPTTGRMTDLQGNVAHQGYGSTVANKPGSWADRRANPGGTPGQSGTTGGTNPYADMTMLYRDNTGMLHDPGDNPITPPSTPGTQNPYDPWGGRNPSRRDMGMRPRNGYNSNGNAITKPNPGANPYQNQVDYYRNQRTQPTTPTTPTTPTASPVTPPTAPNPTTNPAQFGRDPNDPYKPNQNKSYY